MAKAKDVCRLIRSKNAGPFWVTVDFFFKDKASYLQYRDTPTLNGELFHDLFGTDPSLLKKASVDSLNIVKISYARPHPQAWKGERDMHAGQQFARLLDVELA